MDNSGRPDAAMPGGHSRPSGPLPESAASPSGDRSPTEPAPEGSRGLFGRVLGRWRQILLAWFILALAVYVPGLPGDPADV